MGSPLVKNLFRETMRILFSIINFPPFGFVLKPVWSIDIIFGADRAKSKVKHDSAVSLPKPYESTKRALIRTRRGETDYVQQSLLGFKRNLRQTGEAQIRMGDWRSAVTVVKTYEPTKRASIQTRRGETDSGEQYLHAFAKSMF